MSMPRLCADARVVELLAAMTEIIDASYQDEPDVDTIRQIAIHALVLDAELRERMRRDGIAGETLRGALGPVKGKA